MSDEGASGNGAAPNWAAIREEYEGRKFLPAMICKRYGISLAQLRYRREIEGWLSARARIVRQDGPVARMLKVLDKQVRRLEMAVNETDRKTGQCARHVGQDAGQADRAGCGAA
ncbi:hypothetical protein N8D56_21775 [Devosia sp. A8/3-2]|nr:hypothetical protein N8D56_21775 [Devosia sp. A8/3-2]